MFTERTTGLEAAPAADRNLDRELEFLKQLIPITAARRFIPSSHAGKSINPATLWRWVRSGVKAPSGQRVRLRAVRLGHGWMTTPTWILEFVEAISSTNSEGTPTVPVAASTPPSTPQMSVARRRAAERAQAELARLGMGA